MSAEREDLEMIEEIGPVTAENDFYIQADTPRLTPDPRPGSAILSTLRHRKDDGLLLL